MLLTGPSGCGKTATVRVLSLEMGLRVQEWSSPTNLEAYSSSHGEETSVCPPHTCQRDSHQHEEVTCRNSV